jgi:HK97 family phage portal protein
MGLIDRILGRESEQRAIGGGWNENWWGGGNIQSAGVAINEDNATSIGAVYAAVKLYADTVASLPWGAYIRDTGTRRPVARPRWMENPIPNNPNFTGFDLRHRTVTSLLIDGNAFLLTLRDETGNVVEIRVLDPRKVEVEQLPDGTPQYKIKTLEGSSVHGPDDILHIVLFAGVGESLRGLSPVEHHRETLGLASATQRFSAKFYEQGAAPSGIIKVPGDLTADQAEQLRASFGRRHEGIDKMHKVAVITGGADFQQLSAKITDLQLVQTMAWGVEAIGRIYGVPLHLLQYPGGNSSYNSVEIVSIEWLRLGLGPLIARLEAAFQRLVIGQTTFVKFNLDGMLRATTAERFNAYAVALNNGWISVNEIRQLEDRSPIGDEGDKFRIPLNIGITGEDSTRSDAETAGVLVRAGFDPIDSAKVAGLPPIKHSGAAPVTVQGDK